MMTTDVPAQRPPPPLAALDAPSFTSTSTAAVWLVPPPGSTAVGAPRKKLRPRLRSAPLSGRSRSDDNGDVQFALIAVAADGSGWRRGRRGKGCDGGDSRGRGDFGSGGGGTDTDTDSRPAPTPAKPAAKRKQPPAPYGAFDYARALQACSYPDPPAKQPTGAPAIRVLEQSGIDWAKRAASLPAPAAAASGTRFKKHPAVDLLGSHTFDRLFRYVTRVIAPWLQLAVPLDARCELRIPDDLLGNREVPMDMVLDGEHMSLVRARVLAAVVLREARAHVAKTAMAARAERAERERQVRMDRGLPLLRTRAVTMPARVDLGKVCAWVPNKMDDAVGHDAVEPSATFKFKLVHEIGTMTDGPDAVTEPAAAAETRVIVGKGSAPVIVAKSLVARRVASMHARAAAAARVAATAVKAVWDAVRPAPSLAAITTAVAPAPVSVPVPITPAVAPMPAPAVAKSTVAPTPAPAPVKSAVAAPTPSPAPKPTSALAPAAASAAVRASSPVVDLPPLLSVPYADLLAKLKIEPRKPETLVAVAPAPTAALR
ncbi:hypothetical protein AMAG_18598 [Allomyces macrogynus ATCC 38327]|uniref:Uncharacterized protein n=1 Tax=Allomyces macrogynus (strain ATCC 38327) TaxID=578462 RepID=A0A0L0SDX2_ALLM3|nr:hypothetical protein AMAG_18598 [Allomyces macrogynus ATCC 38327]|eukprot:KNE60748.1 hypothetical protein AMAG_18598 [Allomyces macrogynus ATCC 38327]